MQNFITVSLRKHNHDFEKRIIVIYDEQDSEAVINKLSSNPVTGLTEEQVSGRQAQYGANKLKEKKAIFTALCSTVSGCNDFNPVGCGGSILCDCPASKKTHRNFLSRC
jgi:magnesium-transporting ATPase (P-type)